MATDPSGGFVVAWFSETQDGSSFGIFGQRFTEGPAPTSVAPAMSSGMLLVTLCLLGGFGVARLRRRRRNT